MTEQITADACVIGGGPAGLVFALALAAAGRDVVVVEKNEDFDRSFRGESILPDSVWLLDQLGLLQPLRDQKVLEAHGLDISENGRPLLSVDFRRFDQPQPFPMEIPQPMLLRVITEAASRRPGFRIIRPAKAVGLLRVSGRVTGVRCQTQQGELEIISPVTIGADGRYSKIRDMAGIEHHKAPLERDVLWFKMPYPQIWEPNRYRIRIKQDRHAIFLPTHPNMVRVGFNIPKGGLKDTRAAGIGALHDRMDELAPELGSLVREHVTSWSDTIMLDIFTTVVPQWSIPGLVLIGDAAHTLSPILGHGVNHAIMDALVLARLVDRALAGPDTGTALDRAGIRFRLVREGKVRQARHLQLRQEKIFTLASPPATLLRRSLYRMINGLPPVKQRVLGRAYFTIPQVADPVAQQLQAAEA
ncbi:FAD-dependent oxidoreductase [Streptomyces sp. BK340]|uniref:FAD-dependent oxidoreductase n=1 Tax=Streptomyces sp. BK340 TaxID=2572903 RepID=UPI00119F56DB|nr:FAD-dependent oxidoreductase [Streptomyces sp. BK340]TVZ75515.1 2-polyprenyl-6-methoxyphenol hydroxylase-like FAD-dependent oxidoreductase [Streptomyces sp. BK340]